MLDITETNSEKISANGLYGKHIMDMPGLNTLKTLETRKIYLLKKLHTDTEKNSYLINEIRALEKAMNFIRWIIKNASNEAVQKTIEEYKAENKNIIYNEELENDKYENESEIVYSYEEEMTKKYKLVITFLRTETENSILLESNRRKEDMVSWKRIGKFKVTSGILERILETARDIENYKKPLINSLAQVGQGWVAGAAGDPASEG